MTSKRDLGQPLAFAGLGVVIVAVIAGFIAVGGPGDARDRRLDDIAMNRLIRIAGMAECIYGLTDKAPSDINDLREKVSEAARTNPDRTVCNAFNEESVGVSAGYTRLSDDHIRLCATFRRPSDPERDRQFPVRAQLNGRFSELATPHPAGQHCYDVQLVKPQPVPLR